jgi:hypothetical protein
VLCAELDDFLPQPLQPLFGVQHGLGVSQRGRILQSAPSRVHWADVTKFPGGRQVSRYLRKLPTDSKQVPLPITLCRVLSWNASAANYVLLSPHVCANGSSLDNRRLAVRPTTGERDTGIPVTRPTERYDVALSHTPGKKPCLLGAGFRRGYLTAESGYGQKTGCEGLGCPLAVKGPDAIPRGRSSGFVRAIARLLRRSFLCVRYSRRPGRDRSCRE